LRSCFEAFAEINMTVFEAFWYWALWTHVFPFLFLLNCSFDDAYKTETLYSSVSSSNAVCITILVSCNDCIFAYRLVPSNIPWTCYMYTFPHTSRFRAFHSSNLVDNYTQVLGNKMGRSKQIFFVADLCKLSFVGNYMARIMQFFVSNKQNNAIARQFLITFIKLIIWIWICRLVLHLNRVTWNCACFSYYVLHANLIWLISFLLQFMKGDYLLCKYKVQQCAFCGLLRVTSAIPMNMYFYLCHML
jgi:hypothetical protein